MKWCVEANDGSVVEVTELFDREGLETDSLAAAEACVIRHNDQEWRSATVQFGFVHRIQ